MKFYPATVSELSPVDGIELGFGVPVNNGTGERLSNMGIY